MLIKCINGITMNKRQTNEYEEQNNIVLLKPVNIADLSEKQLQRRHEVQLLLKGFLDILNGRYKK